jgi:thiol:disulfide interchange protein DsbD
MWMVGVRRVFGVILVAMAAYFAAPVMPGDSGRWLMSAVLVLGALYLLVIDRTGHEQPTIDRVMRVLSAAMVVAGVVMAPAVYLGGTAAGDPAEHLAWQPYDAAAVESAVAGGGRVILDFYADWCAPCRELDEKTFPAPDVSALLEGYSRFKVDLTRSSEENQALATKYSVRGVPTVIVFSGGEEIFRITGFEPPAKFLARLQQVP